MPKNSNQNKGIKSGRDNRDPETKGRDRISARCRRTQNKRKRLNLGAMPENLNQNKGIESRHDAGEPKIKEEIKYGRNAKEPETKERIDSRRDAEEHEKKKEGIEFGRNAREPESKQRDRIWARCRRTRNKKGSDQV